LLFDHSIKAVNTCVIYLITTSDSNFCIYFVVNIPNVEFERVTNRFSCCGCANKYWVSLNKTLADLFNAISLSGNERLIFRKNIFEFNNSFINRIERSGNADNCFIR